MLFITLAHDSGSRYRRSFARFRIWAYTDPLIEATLERIERELSRNDPRSRTFFGGPDSFTTYLQKALIKWEPLTERRRRKDDELSLLIIELKLILTHPASHFSNATFQLINGSV